MTQPHIPKRRGYRPGDRAAPYAGPDPIEASRRLAETEAAARSAEGATGYRRAMKQSEETKE
jgi:hypothetical protein